MKPEERRSIENGIWMCYKHGKLVDTDEVRFTIPILKKWREIAEARAQFRHDHGSDANLPSDRLLDIGFADQTLSFDSPKNDTVLIGRALLDSCIPQIWGADLGHAIRDVLVEILRNTFVHGGATQCTIGIRRTSIQVTDNGADFNWLTLPAVKTGRGGAAAVKNIFKHFGDKLILGSKRHSNENLTTVGLAHSLADLSLVKPCSFEATKEDSEHIRHHRTMPSSWFPADMEACRIVYIMLPEFMALSDAMLLSAAMKSTPLAERQIVFVTKNTSCGVKEGLMGFFPTARVIDIPTEEAE